MNPEAALRAWVDALGSGAGPAKRPSNPASSPAPRPARDEATTAAGLAACAAVAWALAPAPPPAEAQGRDELVTDAVEVLVRRVLTRTRPALGTPAVALGAMWMSGAPAALRPRTAAAAAALCVAALDDAERAAVAASPLEADRLEGDLRAVFACAAAVNEPDAVQGVRRFAFEPASGRYLRRWPAAPLPASALAALAAMDALAAGRATDPLRASFLAFFEQFPTWRTQSDVKDAVFALARGRGRTLAEAGAFPPEVRHALLRGLAAPPSHLQSRAAAMDPLAWDALDGLVAVWVSQRVAPSSSLLGELLDVLGEDGLPACVRAAALAPLPEDRLDAALACTLEWKRPYPPSPELLDALSAAFDADSSLFPRYFAVLHAKKLDALPLRVQVYVVWLLGEHGSRAAGEHGVLARVVEARKLLEVRLGRSAAERDELACALVHALLKLGARNAHENLDEAAAALLEMERISAAVRAVRDDAVRLLRFAPQVVALP